LLALSSAGAFFFSSAFFAGFLAICESVANNQQSITDSDPANTWIRNSEINTK
jgi:hypothetical protein